MSYKYINRTINNNTACISNYNLIKTNFNFKLNFLSLYCNNLCRVAYNKFFCCCFFVSYHVMIVMPLKPPNSAIMTVMCIFIRYKCKYTNKCMLYLTHAYRNFKHKILGLQNLQICVIKLKANKNI